MSCLSVYVQVNTGTEEARRGYPLGPQLVVSHLMWVLRI